MARIEVKWNDTTLSPGTTETPGRTGGPRTEGSTTFEDLAVKSGKPTILFLFAPSDEKKVKLIEGAVFRNEKVGCAAKMFHLVRLDVEARANGGIPEDYRENTPRFLFLGSDGELVARLDRNITAPNFLGAMKKAFSREYSFSFDALLKAQKEILDRVDRVEGKKSLLAQKEAALKTKGKSKAESEKRKIEEDREEVAKEEKEVLEDEKQLYERLETKRAPLAKG